MVHEALGGSEKADKAFGLWIKSETPILCTAQMQSEIV
jgi:hypothetical protein